MQTASREAGVSRVAETVPQVATEVATPASAWRPRSWPVRRCTARLRWLGDTAAAVVMLAFAVAVGVGLLP